MTPDKLNNVFDDRDYPVLLEAARVIDGGGGSITFMQLAEITGMEPAIVQRAMASLETRGLVRVAKTLVGPHRIVAITARAQTITGLYPDDDDVVAQRLVQYLEQAIEQAKGDEKTKLQRLLASAVDVPKGFLSGLAVELVMRSNL